ncbi:MAG: DUF1801 domain-containing protein [Pseudomonadota bacterium]
MTVEEQVEAYIAAQPEPKRSDMHALHQIILHAMPGARLWFLDGRNDAGKIVSNPNIGYGHQTMSYADGSSRDFYRIGISGNSSGISLYVMGIDDKTYLARTYGERIGKASVTRYCIRFRALKDVDVAVLEEVIATAAEVISP